MFVKDIPNLTSATDVKWFLNTIKEKMGDRKTILIFDTWQRATSAAGQSSDEDMNVCVRHIEKMGHILDAPMIAAFHPPKQNPNTIHGSAIIENVTTTIWQVEENSGGVKAFVARIKAAKNGSYRNYSFVPVELEDHKPNYFGKRYVGVVPIKTGGTEMAYDKEYLDGKEKKRKALAWALRGGIEGPSMFDEPQNSNARSTLLTYVAEKYSQWKEADDAENTKVINKLNPFIDKFIKPMLDTNQDNITYNTLLDSIKLEFYQSGPQDILFEDNMKLRIAYQPGTVKFKEANLRAYLVKADDLMSEITEPCETEEETNEEEIVTSLP
jgi:hypothetical protein